MVLLKLQFKSVHFFITSFQNICRVVEEFYVIQNSKQHINLRNVSEKLEEAYTQNGALKRRRKVFSFCHNCKSFSLIFLKQQEPLLLYILFYVIETKMYQCLSEINNRFYKFKTCYIIRRIQNRGAKLAVQHIVQFTNWTSIKASVI